MSKIFKKTLSMVLALVMVLGMVPVSAFATETEPVEHVHDYQSAVTTEAGCTTEGVMTYTCSCEDSYTEAIPAKGHSYENGLCACGATEPVEHSHDYQSTVTTEAGCTTEGVMTYTCSCEDSYTEAIPAKGHSYENGLCACGATEPAAEPEEDEAVVAARALIEALPTSVTTEAERDAVWAVMGVVEALSAEQKAQLDMARYNAAVDAAAAYNNSEYDDDVVWAEADGWYWDGTTLYIKNGLITQSQFYNAIAEKYGSGTYRYAVSLPSEITFWTGAGADVGSSSTSAITVSRDSAAVGKKGSPNYKDWTGWGANSTTNTFTVEYYYVPTVSVSGHDSVELDSTLPTKVIHGNGFSFELTSPGASGWIAKVNDGDGLIQSPGLSATDNTTITIGKVESANDAKITVNVEEAISYTVTAESNNEAYGDVEVDVASGIEGTTVNVTVTPVGKNSRIVNVTADGATLTDENTNADGVYTAKFVIGQRNVTVSAKFRCLSGNGNADVFFNTYSAVGVSGQMNDGDYYADVKAEQYLEEEIFEALGIAYSHAPDGFDWDDVTIKYYPRLEHVLSENEWYATAYNLNESAPDDVIYRDEYYKNFYERGINQTEKVQISYDGLIYDATIRLVEGRIATLPAVTGASAESKDGPEGITGAAMAKAQEAYTGYTATALTGAAITTEGWLATVNALATGETADVNVQANFAGDASYQSGTVNITVTVTKSATLPAAIEYSENDANGGNVTLTKKDGTAVDSNGVFVAEGPVTVTVTPASGNGYGYYVESIVVNDADNLEITYNKGVATASFGVENSESETKKYTVAVTYGKIELAAKNNTVSITGWRGENGGDRSYALADVKAEYTTANFLDAENTSVVEGAGAFTVYMYYERVGDDWLNVQDLDTGNYNFLNTNTTYPVKITWTPTDTAKYPTVTSNEVTATAVEARQQPSITAGTFDTTAKYDTLDQFKAAVKASIKVTYTNDVGVAQDIDKTACGLDVQYTLVEDSTNRYTVKAKANKAGENWVASEDYTDIPGTYTFVYNQYTAKFVDADDFKVDGENAVLYTTTINNESTPEYEGETTTEQLSLIHDTDEWDYTFNGWDKADANGEYDGNVDEVSAIAGANVTYKAVYSKAKQTYTVTFEDYDGSVIGQPQTVEYGESATAPEATQQYKTNTNIYTFKGWDNAFDNITDDLTVAAQYNSETRYYTVTFKNYDGTLLQQVTGLEYNDVPEYTGATPEKAAEIDDNDVVIGTYKHSGWDKEIVAVTGDGEEYTATFDYALSKYTITWTANGETFATQNDDYGEPVTLPTGTPADYVDANGTNWTFDKWDAPADLGTIAGDKEYAALYKQSGNDAKIVHTDGTETYCKDLATALTQVEAGETIVMLADATMTGKITIDRDITIDGDAGEGKTYKIIANHPYFILETSSDCTIKNVVLDTANNSKGVKITNGDVVFDNITITKPAKNENITVYGTLTLKTFFKAEANTSVFDVRNSMKAEEGTVLDLIGSIGSASPATSDLKGTVDTEGVLYFCAYSDTNYYVNMPTSFSGTLTLLKDATVSYDTTITGTKTIDLDGHTLTIAEGKAVNVGRETATVNNPGYLTFTNEGSVVGSIVLNNTASTVTGSKSLPVTQPFDGYKVVYVDGVHHFGTTVTWSVDGNVTTEDYVYGKTPEFEGSTDKAADAQYTYTFAGWTTDGETVLEVLPGVEAPVTYTAQYSKTVNSYKITFTDENGDVLDEQTLNYGVMPEFKGTVADREYYSWDWDEEIVSVSGEATYKLVWTLNNDVNTNGVADELETAEIAVNITGEGRGAVTLTAATGAILTDNEDGSYTLLFNSNDAATQVVTVTATPAAQDIIETQTTAYYVASNPGTLNVQDGENTVDVAFGTITGTNTIQVGVNGYVVEKLGYDDYSARIADLKAKVLNGVFGANNYNPDDYTVSMYAEYDLTHNWTPGYKNVENDLSGYFVNINATEKFRVTHNATNVVIDVEGTIYDSRDIIDPTSFTVSEQQDLGEMNNDKAVADMKTKLGLNISLTDTKITAGALPTEAGQTSSVTYSARFAGNETYQGATITITYENVYKAYNDCTVQADGTLTAGGSMSVSPVISTENGVCTVTGNTNVSITVTPSGDNVVETVTVTNKTTGASVTTSAITYKNKQATVTFKTGGATASDEYVVSATYSQNYLNLNADQTIVYCVDDEDNTYDLQKLVFDAIFGGSSAPMTKNNVTLEYKYGGVFGIEGWADVSKEPAINLGSLTHKFGESGSETIRIKYSDDKYGSFNQQIVLNVFDACYDVEVTVQTITNGAEATIKTQYSDDSREFKGIKYFKTDTELTVTLTPDGAILDVLGQLYNGTYSESMAYIKSVTVYERGGDVVESAVVTRGQGKLDLSNILQGVNPMLYNAAVTFTLEDEKDYFVVVEYAILELEKAVTETVTLPMYQAGADNSYAAEVPSAQEIVNAVLGEEYAADFLATYGGAFKVEFSTDLINYKWTEVSDEALLALSDGAKLRVRITWRPLDGDKTYYPVAQQADLKLVDGRTATSVKGEVPDGQVNFISEDKLIAELKEDMGLGILANGEELNVNYAVTYNLKGNETDGFFADVTVTYYGSEVFKPATKTFENVPVANRPDDATIKITIENASDVVTNNDGKVQAVDPESGVYTVIGNGTYGFKFTPASGPNYAIESVTVNGEAVEVTYDNRVVSFSMVLNEKEHYEVVVKTVDSVWALEDERAYDFAYGVTTPNNADILDAATKAPTDINFEDATVEYLARAEGKVTVTLPDIELGFINIPLGTFDIDLGELWLNPEESKELVSEDQLDKILDGLLDDVVEKVGSGDLAATNALSYIKDYIKNLPLGIHAFGEGGDGSTETVRFSYADDKYLLAEVATDITIHDYRIATELVASDCEVSYGYSAAQLIAASGAQVTADGAAVSGLAIETNDLYKHAGEQTATLFFKGDVDYQPCEVTINVTVNKAACDIDYDSQVVTFGDDYDFSLKVNPEVMPDGTNSDIERIEFAIALNMNELLDVDISDKSIGFNKAITRIQLRLPQSIRELPLVGEYLQGEFSLNEFTNLINGLDDILGIDENSMGILNQVMEAITGFTDSLDIRVVIKDEEFKPKNIGVYVVGAVTVDADFETAYTADYLVILPKTTQATLAWDYELNGILALPQVEAGMLGAHVVEDDLQKANDYVKYLVLGINDETSEFLSTDIYGNIKANIWATSDTAGLADAFVDNGAYVEIAYLLNWGNELFYGMPIIRSFLVIPEVIDVELVGDTGTPNDELLKTFDGQPKGFSVIVKDSNGDVLYSDHYQNIVELKEEAQLIVNYVGVQTNGKVYNSSEKPVHAGVYAVTAIYLEFTDGEKIDISNMEVEDLYEIFDLSNIGADAGLLVIEPSESTVTVEDQVKVFDGEKVSLHDMVNAASVNYSGNVDTTIISAMVTTDGTFSENGFDSIRGVVNIDFPRWVDELIAEYAPGVANGVTVAQLRDKLINNLPDISAKLEDAGATPEIINSLGSLTENLASALEKLPADAELSFNNDVEVAGVGAYLVMAVVTDSDHYPSADAGLLIITPNVDQVYLKWNYEDSNNVWTPVLLECVDLYASAYDDEAHTVLNDEATAKITHRFLSVDMEGNVVNYTDASQLGLGAYIELAYIELEVDGRMIISDMIARPIIIVPNTVEVEIVDGEGTDFQRVFDNAAQEVDVTVNFGSIEALEPDEKYLTVTYTGIQTNLQRYNSSEAPKHAGVYLVSALYAQTNEKGDYIAVGADVETLVILPAESETIVDDAIIPLGTGIKLTDLITVNVDSGVTMPDMTIISAQVASDGSFSENGWSAIKGKLNIDFPDWVDALLAEHMPGVADGMTAAELSEMLNGKLPALLEKLEEIGATNEIVNSAKNAIANITKILDKVPEDVTLTFDEASDVFADSVGAYMVAAIVTDSDHYPSADYGLLVVTPDVDQVYLKWNYEDENAVWTHVLLQSEDLYATAFDDDAYTVPNAEATAKISYQFLSLDENGELTSYTDVSELTNGFYIEIAYIEFVVDGVITMSDLIARPVIIAPNAAEVIFVDEKGDENNDRVFTFDNEGKTMDAQVSFGGEVIIPEEGELEITYKGVQTNGKTYNSTEAPVHAGVYLVNATYTSYDEHGLALAGTASGIMVIEPADSAIEVTGGTVVYDGAGHTASVAVTKGLANADYVLISGGVDNANVDELTVEDFIGTVNIDLPRWLDEALAEHEFKTEGVDAAYLTDFITSYRDDLVAAVPAEMLVALGVAQADVDAFLAEMNAYIDELLEIVGKIPADAAITFNDNVTYTEAGYYFFYGIVADSDHYPSGDAGLLVIEPKAITEADVKLGDALTYNGAEQTQGVIVTDGITYEVIGNTGTNAGEYTLTVKGTDNYTGSVDLTWTIAKKDITGAKVTLGKPLTYNGAEQTQGLVSVVIDGLEVTFDATDNKATDAGDYTMTITGNGNFTGSVTADWTIAKKDIADAKVTLGDALTYNSSEQTKKVVSVTVDGLEVTYDVSGNTGTNAGKYTMTITGTGNFTGTTDVDWYISKANVTVKVVADEITYGDDIPAVKLEYSNEKAREELNISMVWSAQKFSDVGTYGTSFTWIRYENWDVEYVPAGLTIVPKNITGAKVTLGDDLVYNTEEQTKTVESVVIDGMEATFEVSGNKQTNAGDYTMTITGTGNFTGTIYEGWSIAKASVIVTVLHDSITYGEKTPEVRVSYSDDKAKDEVVYDIYWDAPEYAEVGHYAFKFEAKTFPNWNVEVVGGVLTVGNKVITAADITLVDSKLVYDGTEKTQNIIVADGITYTVTGNKATDAGKHILSVTGTGNYGGTVDFEWTIAKANVKVEILSDEITYGADTPAVKLRYSDEKAEGILSSVKWSAPEKLAPAGTYTATFAFNKEMLSNWTFSVVGGKLTVNPKTITGAEVTLAESMTYTGEQQTATPVIKVGDVVLDADDYTVTGNTATNAGEYSMVIEGTGNYTGSVKFDWTMAKAKVTVTVVSDTITYGDDVPAVELVYSNEKARDELNISMTWNAQKGSDVGTYGTNFTWMRYENWEVHHEGGQLTIVPKPITADDIKLGDALTYNGEEQTQEIILPEGVDYRVVGNSRTNAGDYTMIVIVEGNGNYTGSVEIPWSIAPKAITEADVALSGTLTYNGNEQTQNITVTEGITYDVTGNTATNAGKYTMTVTGTDNYTGEVKLDWSIAQAKVTVTIKSAEVVYGEDIPAVELVYSDELAEEELNISMTWNAQKGSNVGTYGTNFLWVNYQNWIVDYQGGQLTIVPKTISLDNIVLDGTLTYNGEEQTQKITLPEGVTVTVTGDTGTNAGEYTMTVTGTGNYAGEVEVKWTIDPKPITKDDITLGEELSYNGKEQTQEFVLPEGYTYTVTGNTGTDAGEYTATIEGTGNYSGKVEVEWTIKDAHPGLYPVYFDVANDDTETIVPGASVEIDGVPYVLDEDCIAWVANTDAKIVTTYKYNTGATAYESYPTNMYVWYLTIVDSNGDREYDYYNAERVEELDDFFKYEGTSIRVNFTSNGIRFFTSVDSGKLNSLKSGTLLDGKLEGFTMTRAGTLYKKWTGDGAAINYESAAASDVYGGKAGSNFRVFSTVKGRVWYTGMLTGLDGKAETLDMDIQSRPFAILERDGESFVLYGGTIQRSIYYVATQNRDYWAPGTAYDNFVESIITTVENARGNS